MRFQTLAHHLRTLSPKRRHLRYLGWFVLLAILGMRRDTLPALDFYARLDNLTAPYQFNFFDWSARAIANKLGQNAIQDQHYLSAEQRHAIVTQYFELLGQIQQLENEIEDIYADPGFSNHALATSQQSAELARLRADLQALESLPEAILQEQIALTLVQEGFGIAQQLQPPVSFNIDSLPYFLIVSPRDKIENKAFANLVPGMTVAERSQLEGQVDARLDVSSLIEPIGGLATFPTMVYETTNLPFVLEVGAHEWCHNFLMLRPLGILFSASPQMRTINETTCTIVGKEVGQAAVARYYPELLAPAPAPSPSASEAPPTAQPTPSQPTPPPFDFRKEMHETRVQVDALLTAGEINTAEAYMEERRQLFWENGYRIRKLNQAYFAFYGAYADGDGGAAGADPVGPAVVQLREQSADLHSFLEQISWLTSFEQLQTWVQEK